MLLNIKKCWRYIKCVLLLKREIGIIKKYRFYHFGKNSTISRPYLQLSGIDKVQIGNNTTLLSNSRLAVFGDFFSAPNISIGNNCYIGFNFTALSFAKSKLVIGNNVLIASNVTITNENHGMNPYSDIPYMNQELSSSDVIIGDGCWIGEKVCILPGVRIGNKSIIGAGAVVTKSIPEYSIAVGNPAKVIKKYNFEQKRWVNYHE